MEPWLAPLLRRLAPNAAHTDLLHSPGTVTRELRDNDAFEGHDHDHSDHDYIDPHAWLDPVNAMTWVTTLAAELSALDPENEDTYLRNAQVTNGQLTQLIAQIETTLAPVRSKKLIVFRDAFHYFEARFEHEASAAISLSDASTPSPARIEQVQTLVRKRNISRAFAEPQFSDGLVTTVLDGTNARVAILDPLGATLTPGPDFYGTLLRNMAKAVAEC